VGKNMVIGVIPLIERGGVGSHLSDSFFDSFQEEMRTAYDIIDIANNDHKPSVIIEFDKVFLKRIVKNYILFIQELEIKGQDANRYPTARKNGNSF